MKDFIYQTLIYICIVATSFILTVLYEEKFVILMIFIMMISFFADIFKRNFDK